MWRQKGGHKGNPTMEPWCEDLDASAILRSPGLYRRALASGHSTRNGHVALPFQTGTLPPTVSIVDRR
jgi:hypothetical protein